MSPETLLLIAGCSLSLGFKLIPGLSGWYAKLASEVKQSLMLGLVVLSAASIFGLSCAGVMSDLWPEFTVACDAGSFWLLVRYMILAVISNVGTYGATKYLANGKSEKA